MGQSGGRELTLYLLDGRDTSEFCAWLIRKVGASVGGYVAPSWVRVTVEREDRIEPVLQHVTATVPDAWTTEVQERLAVLIDAGLVIEMPNV